MLWVRVPSRGQTSWYTSTRQRMLSLINYQHRHFFKTFNFLFLTNREELSKFQISMHTYMNINTIIITKHAMYMAWCMPHPHPCPILWHEWTIQSLYVSLAHSPSIWRISYSSFKQAIVWSHLKKNIYLLIISITFDKFPTSTWFVSHLTLSIIPSFSFIFKIGSVLVLMIFLHWLSSHLTFALRPSDHAVSINDSTSAFFIIFQLVFTKVPCSTHNVLLYIQLLLDQWSQRIRSTSQLYQVSSSMILQAYLSSMISSHSAHLLIFYCDMPFSDCINSVQVLSFPCPSSTPFPLSQPQPFKFTFIQQKWNLIHFTLPFLELI